MKRLLLTLAVMGAVHTVSAQEEEQSVMQQLDQEARNVVKNSQEHELGEELDALIAGGASDEEIVGFLADNANYCALNIVFKRNDAQADEWRKRIGALLLSCSETGQQDENTSAMAPEAMVNSIMLLLTDRSGLAQGRISIGLGKVDPEELVEGMNLED